MIDDMILRAYPKTRIVTLPFAGHTVLQVLNNIRKLNDFVYGVIADDQIISLDGSREDDPIWHFQKGRQMRRENPEQAQYHLERSLDLSPNRHVIGNLMAILLRLRKLDAAQALIDRVNSSDNPKMKIPPSNLERARALGLKMGGL